MTVGPTLSACLGLGVVSLFTGTATLKSVCMVGLKKKTREKDTYEENGEIEKI